MDTFWNVLLWAAGTVLVIIFITALVKLLSTMTQVVPQEKRLVIYQLGRFNRVAGPGPVQVMPVLEKVVDTIEVRDHPLELTVSGIFAFGVPNDLTLNLWCGSDLVKATDNDREKLAQLVQISQAERRQQVQVKMREALVRQIADLQERMSLPDKATLMERIVALAPGSPRHNELLKRLKYDLSRILPSVGVVLNMDHPIVLTGRNISDEIVDAIKRQRGREMDSEWLMKYANELRRQFPGISNATLAQMLLSIEGVDVGNIQRLFLEQEEGTQTEVEFEMSGDGSSFPNVVTKPKPQAQGQAARPTAPRHLTKSDLAVLKRVPHSEQDQRMSA